MIFSCHLFPGCPLTKAVGLSACGLLLSVFAAMSHAAGETLEIRNSSPLAQLYGLPSTRGRRAESTGLRFSIDTANSFTGDFNSSEFVFLDGETSVFSYTLRRPYGDRWEVGLELPWVVHSGGRFDGLIDEFHDLFGLPDGGRPLAPRGEIDYVVRTDGMVRAEVRSKRSDIGDVRGWIGFGLLEQPARSVTARAHLKLPTGDVDNLSGSGALDGALAVEYIERGAVDSLGVQISLSAGVAILGDGDLWRERQETLVPFGHFGVALNVGARARLLGQLDAHGALFDAQLSHLGNSVLQGTLGFQYAFSPAVDLQFSLVEDLSGALAADVIFKLALTGRL